MSTVSKCHPSSFPSVVATIDTFTIWYRCSDCYVLLNSPRAFIAHRDKHRHNEGLEQNEMQIDLFHTAAGGICTLDQLPEAGMAIYIPRIRLTPLETDVEDFKIKIDLPNVLLRRPKVEIQQPPSSLPMRIKLSRNRRCVHCRKYRSTFTLWDDVDLCRCRVNARLNVGNFACLKCGRRWPTAATLKAHIEHAHVSEKKYVCFVCSSAFANRRHLKRHVLRNPDHITPEVMNHQEASLEINQKIVKGRERSFMECPVCGRVLRDNYKRRLHIGICQERRQPYFPCLYSCPANFTTEKDLEIHVKLFHETEAKLKCEICGKPCATLESLSRHLKRSCLPKVERGQKIEMFREKEDAPKEFPCKLCGQIFSQRKILNRHVKRVCLKKRKRIPATRSPKQKTQTADWQHEVMDLKPHLQDTGDVM